MKKLLTTTILLAFIGLGVNAQTIAPEVLASSGAHFTGTNASLSWTIGEVMIETVSGTNNMLTQGFHQPGVQATIIEEVLPSHVEINVFPNPATESITVNLENNTLKLNAELYDMTGKLLISKEIEPLQSSFVVNVKDLANAGYLLRIHSEDKKYNATYKIQKVN